MTEKEIVAGMIADVEKVRDTLRQQLMGIENQLFALKKLVEKLEKANEPPPPPPPSPPETKADALEFMGLSSGGADDFRAVVPAEDVKLKEASGEAAIGEEPPEDMEWLPELEGESEPSIPPTDPIEEAHRGMAF